MSSKLKQDTLQRNIIINQIKEVYDLAKEASQNESLQRLFKIRYKSLEETYTTFKQLHLHVASCLNEDKQAEQDDIRKEIDEIYYNILVTYSQIFPEVENKVQVVTQQASSIRARLPELSLPHFNGDIRTYESYIDIFNSLIHESSSLDEISKFQYLILSLSNEPLNLVKSIPLTANNYELAYNTLTERYSNKRLLASVHFNAIKNCQPLRSENPNELRKLVDCFVENIAILKKLGLPTEHWDFILVDFLLEKLDHNTRKRFELHALSTTVPKFEDVKEFILKQCTALDSITVNKDLQKQVHTKPSFQNKSNTKTALVSNESIDENSSNCVLCKKSHFVFKCPSFLSKTPLERFNSVKQHNLCINCLKPNHTLRNCKSTSSCHTCRIRHHTLLHRNKTQIESNTSTSTAGSTVQASNDNTSENTQNQNLVSVSCSSQGKTNVLLGTIVLELRDSFGNFRPVRALLDNASQCSFISQNCLRRFGLKQKKASAPIHGIGQVSSQTFGSAFVTVRPRSMTSPNYDLETIVLQPICANMPNFSIKVSENWSHLENIKLADPQFRVTREIDLLIGAELYPYILRDGIITPKDSNLPVAINTVFGYVVCGNVFESKACSSLQTLCCTVGLDNVVKQFWETENLPERKFLSSEDIKCEDIFCSETRRSKEGRYIVPLPLKDMDPLGDSYQIALRRFLSLERRLKQNSDLEGLYFEFMKDYLDQGHMELVPENQPEPNLVYYIPQQFVLKPDRKTTKLRVVFDASALTSKGISLNDKQFVGPKLQADIAEILLKFRQHFVVFSADIKQMFRNILVHSEYQDLQRILLRFADNEPIRKYRLKTVTYGLASSPYLAIRTLHQLAMDEKERFPRAAKILLNNTFVDDILAGSSSVHEAILLQEELINLLNAGGFILRKWVSNRHEVLKSIPSENQAISFDSNEPHFLKILGLQYCPSSDSFFYQINLTGSTCSKRQILSDIARIFDPLGFLSPITLQAKRFIQLLWVDGLGWDDTPPVEIVDNWQRFKSELPHLSNLRIKRYIPLDNLSPETVVQVHGFSDASSQGLSAVVYFRISEGDTFRVFLVCGKTRVAPLKQVSIPRLELMAAHMLSVLLNFVVDSYKSVCDISSVHCWSDSTVALSWIKSSPHRWKPFVANRVAAVQELTSPSLWHYISSKDNPADAPSRGQYPLEFLENSLWFGGPSWLSLEESLWPKESKLHLDNLDIESEARRHAMSMVVNRDQENFILTLLDRFSSLQKIIRVVAYVRMFVALAKKSEKLLSLSSADLTESLMVIVRVVQNQSFAQEIRSLRQGKPCSKPFRKLNAFLCPAGIFRVGGRLSHADLDFNEKHPAILPRDHRLSSLVIEETHRRYLHPGFNTLKFLIQQNFWILSPKKAINRCLSRCVKCFRTKPKSIEPIMSDLPTFRVNKQLKPFLRVGVDYGGPFTIKCAKHRSKVQLKAYLCLFICLATKAVHLELVSDLSAEAFLAALRRFTARRGTCVEIVSDNGTNFVGANRILNEYCKQVAEAQHIVWRFNPPAAPHMGGIFEAGIKQVKSHLRRVIGTQVLTFEEMYTILTQVEALLNSRPIGPISSDPNDMLPLTPGHFLTLQPLSAPADLDLTSEPMNRLTRWQLIQRIVQDTWKRFRHEYLHTLQQRGKWHTGPVENIKPGTLVLIKDENQPPLKWSLGRILETHVGADGVARIVTLRTLTGVFKRPVVKVCPLPIE